MRKEAHMPWKEYSIMSRRLEFVTLAQHDSVNMAELCRRFGISRKTGYKWRNRYGACGASALVDQSRRPHISPRKSSDTTERAVVDLRRAHPVWGGRKLARRLRDTGMDPVPAPSTVTAILRRHNCIDPAASEQRQSSHRFEAARPNDLWQMDFKGHFALATGRCHPLTVVDDHSRYAVGVVACPNERRETVQKHLTRIFQQYGLPQRMLMDNGTPWRPSDQESETALVVWLMRLGVDVSHGRAYHPQTQGKDERFNQTLKVEVIGHQMFRDLETCQERFDVWRDVYNLERPHEALGLEVPASRYRLSAHRFPETLPPIEYGAHDIVRSVQTNGEISLHNRDFLIGKGFRGLTVALRPTATDGVYDVFFCQSRVAQIDLQTYTAP
jgi:transposase InsO family protein